MTPTPQTWRRVKEIFQVVADAPASERESLLAELCAGVDRVRDEVLALLASHDALPPEPEEVARAPIGEAVGDVIGRYRLEEIIGEGGFGRVFRAAQLEPVERTVAFKVLKPGVDTEQVVARFEAERQTLAALDHPNVATVHDAGVTPSGRPYFVMEFVRGAPITKSCDDARLGIEARVELFRQVALAVEHCHERGIVHRDLKPSNLLVTEVDDKPVPKIIDFGIARAADASLIERQSLQTHLEQLVGTPEYMAPEQAGRGRNAVDDRSDVYSLGVVLYELLTGVLPFDTTTLLRNGFEAMLRHIREVEPQRPSTRVTTLGDRKAEVAALRRTDVTRMSSRLRGDLDWIVMRALDKDPRRRYATAAAFAEDLARFLSHQTVEARPPTAGYKLSKLLRRRRKAIAAAASVLVVGALAGWIAFRELDQSKKREQTNARIDELLADASFVQPPDEANGERYLRLRRAAEKVGRAVELASTDLVGANRRAAVQEIADDIDSSLQDASATFGQARYQEGVAADRANDHDRALECFEECLGLFPKGSSKYADTLSFMTRGLLASHELERALALSTQSLAMQTDETGPWANHTWVLERLNRHVDMRHTMREVFLLRDAFMKTWPPESYLTGVLERSEAALVGKVDLLRRIAEDPTETVHAWGRAEAALWLLPREHRWDEAASRVLEWIGGDAELFDDWIHGYRERGAMVLLDAAAESETATDEQRAVWRRTARDWVRKDVDVLLGRVDDPMHDHRSHAKLASLTRNTWVTRMAAEEGPEGEAWRALVEHMRSAAR